MLSTRDFIKLDFNQCFIKIWLNTPVSRILLYPFNILVICGKFSRNLPSSYGEKDENMMQTTDNEKNWAEKFNYINKPFSHISKKKNSYCVSKQIMYTIWSAYEQIQESFQTKKSYYQYFTISCYVLTDLHLDLDNLYNTGFRKENTIHTVQLLPTDNHQMKSYCCCWEKLLI